MGTQEFEIPFESNDEGKNSPPPLTSKVKLSNEDLLAGKCLPEDENNDDEDSRIKSPDQLLKGLLANKPGAEEKLKKMEEQISQGGLIIDHNESLSREIHTPKPEPTEAHLSDEMMRWKEYELNVQNWRDRVLKIVTHLKKEASKATTLKAEISALKGIIEEKDREIKELKSTKKTKHKRKKH